MNVRPLAIGDIDTYLQCVVAVDAESGVDGAGHSHPYSLSDPFDMQTAPARERTRWSTGIDDPGWRRAWGLFDQGELVGHVHLAGGMLRSDLHRVSVGMGVLSSHRRQGGGTLLLHSAIAWARNQSCIDWIDLGVFSDNPGAQALYAGQGFQVLGRTPDRFRVDGRTLDEIWMTLDVARADEEPRTSVADVQVCDPLDPLTQIEPVADERGTHRRTANQRTFEGMPRLSEFYGIVVYMYFADHNPPHFHAIYAEHEALIRIDDGTVVRAIFPAPPPSSSSNGASSTRPSWR